MIYYSINDADSHELIIDFLPSLHCTLAEQKIAELEEMGLSNFYATEWEKATEEWAEEPLRCMNLEEALEVFK